MRFTTEQIHSRLKEAPDKVKQLVGSEELAEVLATITKKYQLHLDQAGVIGDEINFVILGLARADQFTQNILNQANLSTEKTNEIAKEVNDKIFLKLRESLKQIRPKEETAAAPEKMPEEEISPTAPETEQKEGVVPPNLPTGDISALKLGGMFKVQKEQGESSAAADEKPKQETPKDRGVDPYREPVE